MWPVPVVSGMSDLQCELERRRACKMSFCGTQSNTCTYCENQAGHGSACGELSSRPGKTLALPSFVVHIVEGDASGLCHTPPSGTRSASYCVGGEPGEMVPTMENFPGDVARGVWRVDGHFAI